MRSLGLHRLWLALLDLLVFELRLLLMIVSLVVIMFELTGALPFVLPIMISVMLAKQVADMFGKRGIYETWIHLNGYPYLDKVEEYSRDVGVKDVMTKVEELVVITAVGSTIDSLSIPCC